LMMAARKSAEVFMGLAPSLVLGHLSFVLGRMFHR
jgi:hypothetical protein